MRLDSFDLGLNILVSLEEVIVAESEVFLLLAAHDESVVNVSEAGLSLKHLRIKLLVSDILILSLPLEVLLLTELAIEVSLKALYLYHESGMVVLGSGKLGDGGVEGFISLSKLKLFGVSHLRELIGSFLCLEQVVVYTLNLGIVVLALSLLEGNSISQSIDLGLIVVFLLSQL